MKTRNLLLMQVVLTFALHGPSFGQATVATVPAGNEMTNALEDIAANQMAVRTRATARIGSTSRKEAFKRFGAGLLQVVQGRVAERAPGLWQEAYTQAMPGKLPSYSASPSDSYRTTYIPAVAASWRTIVARDATFQVQLPADWRETGSQTLESFQALSDRGESLSSGMLQVYGNRDVLRANLAAYQNISSREQLILMSRLLSPPLTPTEVVTKLFPRIANGAMQNVSILRTHQLPSLPGGLSAMLLYQYTLLPRQDVAFAATLPMVLRGKPQVPMRAWAIISTDGGNGLTWGLTYGVIAAPQRVFDTEQATYTRIYETYQFIPQGLAQKVHDNAQAAQLAAELTQNTRRIGQMMRDDEGLVESGRRVAGALGGDTIFKGAGVEGTLPTTDVNSNTPYVICHETGTTPIPESDAPLGGHCTAASR